MSDIFSGVHVLHRALDYHLERHNVVASNVANIDTPGFKPADLVREGLDAGPEASLTIKTAHANHLGAGSQAHYERRVSDQESTVPTGADGNSVSLEREMAKIAANDLRYDGASKIITKKLGMLRYAAADGTGR